MERRRCPWCGEDPLYVAYHDEEWGRPVHDDRRLFEFLVLEGAQAGLSWITILRKREGYRKAFAAFDPEELARWGEAEEARLRQDPSIVRNRLKIASVPSNARAFLELVETEGSFDRWIWSFVEGRPIRNAWRRLDALPCETELSARISKALKKRGFRFVGPTMVYSFMQAVGMVNDHLVDCWCHEAIEA